MRPSAATLAHLLRDPAQTCALPDWPGQLAGLSSPGLYAWWADDVAARLISERLGEDVSPGIVYCGQAGAGSGRATLASRIGANHIGGNIRSSTFRKTVAAILLDEIEPCRQRAGVIGQDGERIITAWLATHFRIAVAAHADRGALASIEREVLALLDPPLNLRHMMPTAGRQTLATRRAALRSGPATPAGSPVPSRFFRPDESSGPPRSGSTLHDEIAAILQDGENLWQTTDDIALQVNQRGRYLKRDGSTVSPFQIHGRTRNYSHLFERDGRKVRLRQAPAPKILEREGEAPRISPFSTAPSTPYPPNQTEAPE